MIMILLCVVIEILYQNREDWREGKGRWGGGGGGGEGGQRDIVYVYLHKSKIRELNH